MIHLTEAQLAERWQISVRTLQAARVKGSGVPFVRIGRSVRYRLEDVTHRYPTCWRCKSELAFRVSEEWYIAVGPRETAQAGADEQADRFIRRRMKRACVHEAHATPAPQGVEHDGQTGKTLARVAPPARIYQDAPRRELRGRSHFRR